MLAQNWGNLNYGIRELSQGNGVSEVEAFCWDIETNVKQAKIFTVPHKRYTKRGIKNLTDPRDIYELIANNGARRMRACILGIIPADIVEKAVQMCDQQLKAGGNGKPLADRVSDMLIAFEKLGVTKEMIEARLQHKISAIVEAQLIDLGKIYNGIKDGMSDRKDWFDLPEAQSSQAAQDLTEKIKSSATKPEVKTGNDVVAKITEYISIDEDAWNEAVKASGSKLETMDDVEITAKFFDTIIDKKNKETSC